MISINIAAGNTLNYINTVLPVSTFNNTHKIVYRRVKIPDNKLLINSLELKIGDLTLKEFEDYSAYLNSNEETIVTLKMNNNISAGLNTIRVLYKSDRTIEQMYWDALEVSKRSAFPDAKYEVEFIYLQKALNIKHLHTKNTWISKY